MSEALRRKGGTAVGGDSVADARAAIPRYPPTAEQPVAGPIPRAELAEWRERFGLVAGITLRGGIQDGFSFGLSTDDPVGAVIGRWRALRQAMRPGFTGVVVGHQCHGATIVWHDGAGLGWHVVDDCDGHATDTAGLLLCVTVADCVPVYVTSANRRGFALLHAGWRGVAAGMLEAGLSLLTSRLSVLAADLSIHLGVAICGSCYEVGPEVLEQLTGRQGEGAAHLDLRSLLARRAEAAGVREVTISPFCTSCHRDRFFSHRASGGRDGRLVAYLGRPVA